MDVHPGRVFLAGYTVRLSERATNVDGDPKR